MKLIVGVAVLTAAVALQAPAEAASKKSKKVAHRTAVSAVQGNPAAAQNVYVGNELVGRDPDPTIRAYMMRDPKPWLGND